MIVQIKVRYDTGKVEKTRNSIKKVCQDLELNGCGMRRDARQMTSNDASMEASGSHEQLREVDGFIFHHHIH